MVLEAEATFYNTSRGERNNVMIHLAIDASQREELKKCHDLDQKQVSVLAEWEGVAEQAMGVYLFKEMKMRGRYIISLLSDLYSAEEKLWIDLCAECNSDKDDERKTFRLTIMTVDEAVAYWKQQKAIEQETGDDGND